MKNEFYISTVVAEMIKDGEKFGIEKVDRNKYISLGNLLLYIIEFQL